MAINLGRELVARAVNKRRVDEVMTFQLWPWHGGLGGTANGTDQ